MAEVEFEVDGAIAILTLNRPEVRNAMTETMLMMLGEAWSTIDGDDAIRVAIITGAGGAFCAGGDLAAMNAEQRHPHYASTFLAEKERRWKPLLRSYALRKPLIAAVEGPAVAGGTELLQATDIRVAGESARFGLPEVRLGLFPLAGLTGCLVRQIPRAAAMRLLLTGELIGAEEALRIGLVGTVVPDGTALAAAREIAKTIAANGPLSTQAIKRSVRAAEGLSEEAALASELSIGAPIYATEDALEGTTAFLERRAPVYRGR